MDPFSHGLLGALAASCGAERHETRAAALVGGIAALTPDLDILARAFADPLLELELHRQFTHSLVFIPVLAGAVAIIAWPMARRHLRAWPLFRFALLGVATAGLLDTCTSFGTVLLWPFAQTRFALSIIPVIDPVFTTILLVTVIVSVVRRTGSAAAWGIVLGLIYLGFGGVQHQRAAFVAQTLANDRGHPVERLTAKPTLGNLVVWRTVYSSESRFYIDAVRLGPLGGIKIYEGSSIAKVDAQSSGLTEGSVQMEDARRFSKLADGYTVFHPDDRLVFGDVRYSMLPYSVAPLWGIRLNPARENAHVEYVTLRGSARTMLKDLWALVRGEPIPNRRKAG